MDKGRSAKTTKIVSLRTSGRHSSIRPFLDSTPAKISPDPNRSITGLTPKIDSPVPTIEAIRFGQVLIALPNSVTSACPTMATTTGSIPTMADKSSLF